MMELVQTTGIIKATEVEPIDEAVKMFKEFIAEIKESIKYMEQTKAEIESNSMRVRGYNRERLVAKCRGLAELVELKGIDYKEKIQELNKIGVPTDKLIQLANDFIIYKHLLKDLAHQIEIGKYRQYIDENTQTLVHFNID